MQLNTELLNLIAGGGTPVIIFIVWLFTFRLFTRQQERVFHQNRETVERLFKTIDADIKYKETLTTILSRLEMKIDISSGFTPERKKYE